MKSYKKKEFLIIFPNISTNFFSATHLIENVYRITIVVDPDVISSSKTID